MATQSSILARRASLTDMGAWRQQSMGLQKSMRSGCSICALTLPLQVYAMASLWASLNPALAGGLRHIFSLAKHWEGAGDPAEASTAPSVLGSLHPCRLTGGGLSSTWPLSQSAKSALKRKRGTGRGRGGDTIRNSALQLTPLPFSTLWPFGSGRGWGGANLKEA